MQNLLIEQHGPSGLLKTWRLRPEQGLLTFGHSRHAHLRSPSETIKGIQGAFEYRNSSWFYVHLDHHQQVPELEQSAELKIEQPLTLNVGGTKISLTPYDARSPLFKSIEKSDIHESAAGKKPFQLYVVYHGKTILETRLCPIGETFQTRFDEAHTQFIPTKSETWKHTKLKDIEVSERTVYLTEQEALKSFRAAKMDQESKYTMFATLGGAAILALLFSLAPKREVVTVVEVELPQPIREVKIEPPKKQKTAGQVVPEQKPAPSLQQPQQVAAQPQKAPAAPSGDSKTASAIKNLSSGRISQLVGKVSASAAKSSQVVITSGVKAGSAPSGRALAAVSALEKSGTDWSSEGKGSGITVSTDGKAGGKGTGALGQLAAGKTGQGGVGLLEEEGEIVGGLDREVIAAYIRSQLGQILYCYERQLSANPDLYGKVAVKFTILGDGKVDLQRVTQTTLRNQTVEGCILQRIGKWQFPKPEGGTKVLVTYPFLFKSTN
jgi:outer membrane biosynthesis protein TonB